LHGPGQVDAQVELPVLVTHVLELADRVDHPGVVHADVDRPQVTLDAAHRILHLGGLANVAAVAPGGPAGGRQLLGRLLGALAVEIDDGHPAALAGQHRGVGFAEAAGAPGDERDLAGDPEIHLAARLALGRHQRPLNSGSRLAKKAWIPSAASSLRSVGMKASSSTSIERAIGDSRPSSTARMMAAVASGARLASCRASALASLSVSPSLQSRFTSLRLRHSWAGIWVPRSRNSSAFVRPIRRGSRWVPPYP